MKISEMIAKLSEIQNQIGDQEVLITDEYQGNCYRGNYVLGLYKDGNRLFADIAIGGCMEQ